MFCRMTMELCSSAQGASRFMQWVTRLNRRELPRLPKWIWFLGTMVKWIMRTMQWRYLMRLVRTLLCRCILPLFSTEPLILVIIWCDFPPPPPSHYSIFSLCLRCFCPKSLCEDQGFGSQWSRNCDYPVLLLPVFSLYPRSFSPRLSCDDQGFGRRWR